MSSKEFYTRIWVDIDDKPNKIIVPQNARLK